MPSTVSSITNLIKMVRVRITRANPNRLHKEQYLKLEFDSTIVEIVGYGPGLKISTGSMVHDH